MNFKALFERIIANMKKIDGRAKYFCETSFVAYVFVIAIAPIQCMKKLYYYFFQSVKPWTWMREEGKKGQKVILFEVDSTKWRMKQK